jgi:Cu-processing system ATP-binding protein
VVIVNQGAKIADGSLDALRALARLPVHVRVRPAGPIAAAGWRRLADGSFETTVVPEAKLPILARLLAEPGGLADLTVTEPTLDDLYAHFLRREAA